MKFRNSILKMAIAGLVVSLAGCSTPKGVVALSNKTESAVSRMEAAHIADLEAVKRYDLERGKEFARFNADFEKAVGDVEKSFKLALAVHKEAAKRKVLENFDREAFHILTVEYWLFVDKELSWMKFKLKLKEQKTKTMVTQTDAVIHEKDKNAGAIAMLALRRYLDNLAIVYEYQRRGFADLAQELDKTRHTLVMEIDERFEEIEFQPIDGEEGASGTGDDSNDLKAPDRNVTEIDKRIKKVKEAYSEISEAQSQLTSYLDSRGFLKNEQALSNLIGGVLGIKVTDEEGKALGITAVTQKYLANFEEAFSTAVQATDSEKNSLLKLAKSSALEAAKKVQANAPELVGFDEGAQD